MMVVCTFLNEKVPYYANATMQEPFIMLSLNVDGMTCGHCVGAVTKAIKEKYPQAIVNIYLSEKMVAVDGVDDLSSIAQIIEQAGYTVRS
jgi:copper chaperone